MRYEAHPASQENGILGLALGTAGHCARGAAKHKNHLPSWAFFEELYPTLFEIF